MFSTFVTLLPLVAGQLVFQGERSAWAERRALDATLPRAAGLLSNPVAPPELDYQRFDVDLTWDFRSGAVQGTGTLGVRARTGAATVPLLIDSGLSFTARDVSGPLAVARQGVGDGLDWVGIEVGVGSSDVTLQLAWSGTLTCGAGLGYPRCTRGEQPFVWLDQGSGIPQPIDPVTGISTDRAQRSWVLHTPAGFAVQVAGDFVSESETGATRTSRWATQAPVSLALASWVITGTTLSRAPSPVVHAASAQADTVAAWAQRILPHHVQRLGPTLSTGVAQAIVPRSSTFIGTASYGMSLLNELYDGMGPELHEEVWAHENIHQHFAVRAYPADQTVSAFMTEGITTLLQLDYTHRNLSGVERDRALARRLREFALQQEYRFPQVQSLPLGLQDPAQVPTDPYAYNVWAYFKGSATHDLLRVWLGETVYLDGLTRYLAACDAAPCDNDVFRASLEAASGRSLGALFDRFVFGPDRVSLGIGFEPRPGAAVAVTLEQSRAAALPLELWVEGFGGELERERVLLDGATSTHVFSPGFAVKSVRVNPRVEAILKVDSQTAGDVDFDGEVDGFDVIACARLVGHTVTAPNRTPSIWGTNLDFDRRCDTNHDGNITAAEVAALPFPSFRSSP
ncbi:MAG: hypothetical protein JNK82_31035 [Myxococcaceae bacterium]|nr:hypothetical protein [Myxococcaceae bacterium]